MDDSKLKPERPKVKSMVSFGFARNAVFEFFIMIPVAIIFLIAGGIKVALPYVLAHVLAMVVYVFSAVVFRPGGKSANGDPRAYKAKLVALVLSTFGASTGALIDFIYGYLMLFQVIYCGDPDINSPNFYKALIPWGGPCCDAYSGSGSMYTLAVMFVLFYPALVGMKNALTIIMLPEPAVGPSEVVFPRYGVMAYNALVFGPYSVAWASREWSAFNIFTRGWFASCAIVTLLALAMLLSAVWGFREKIRVRLPAHRLEIVYIIQFCTLGAIGVDCIAIWGWSIYPTVMESVLPLLLFLPNSVYICLVLLADINNPSTTKSAAREDVTSAPSGGFDNPNSASSRRLKAKQHGVVSIRV